MMTDYWTYCAVEEAWNGITPPIGRFPIRR